MTDLQVAKTKVQIEPDTEYMEEWCLNLQRPLQQENPIYHPAYDGEQQSGQVMALKVHPGSACWKAGINLLSDLFGNSASALDLA